MFTNLTVKGEIYNLRLTTKTSIQLEKALGYNPLNLLMAMDNGQVPKLSDCLILLQYMLLSMHHGFNAEKTMELYDDYVEDGGSMLDLIPVFVEVFENSGYIGKSADTEDRAAKN